MKAACRTGFLIAAFLFSGPVCSEVADPDPGRFAASINEFVAWDRKNSFPENAYLFVGSSSIRLWPTAAAFPGLRPLLDDLDQLGEPADLAALRRLMEALRITRADLKDVCIFQDERYRRNMIRRTDFYELVCLCWRSGQRTPIHDHLGSACAFRVVEGNATVGSIKGSGTFAVRGDVSCNVEEQAGTFGGTWPGGDWQDWDFGAELGKSPEKDVDDRLDASADRAGHAPAAAPRPRHA